MSSIVSAAICNSIVPPSCSNGFLYFAVVPTIGSIGVNSTSEISDEPACCPSPSPPSSIAFPRLIVYSYFSFSTISTGPVIVRFVISVPFTNSVMSSSSSCDVL